MPHVPTQSATRVPWGTSGPDRAHSDPAIGVAPSASSFFQVREPGLVALVMSQVTRSWLLTVSVALPSVVPPTAEE